MQIENISKQRQRLLMDLRENEMFLELLKTFDDPRINYITQEVEQIIMNQHILSKNLEQLEGKYHNLFN